MYVAGEAIGVTGTEAVRWLELARDRGVPEAETYYGRAYERFLNERYPKQ